MREIAPSFVCATTARDPCASMLRGPSSVRTLRCSRPDASERTPTKPSVSAVARVSAGRESCARRANGAATPAARNSRRSTAASAPAGAPRQLLRRRQRLGLRHDLVLAPAQALGRIAVAQDAARQAGRHRVGRDRLRDDRVRPDHRVVADRHAAQDAGAVAHPHVVADVDVALVDALLADGPLDLDDAVVEVDEHHAIGDDALATDRHVLERADGALLADHRLRADDDLALVRPDLGAVADPRPAPEDDAGVRADLELHARADEADAVGLQPPAPAQLQPRPARDEEPVLDVEHAVGPHEAQEHERPAVHGRRLASDDDVGRRGRRGRGQDGLHDRQDAKDAAPMGRDDNLAQRLLDGDKRALARAITLVENNDPAGWELVREVFPRTGRASIVGLTGAPGAGKSTLIGALTKLRREQDREVAVLSIDPSSPFTQGALLGDRIRLTDHFLDPGVFIRSMANRGALGGLSEAALQAALLMDASGKEDVFLETVGVGQAEIDVIDHADTIVLVLMPGSGDSIQALKAGIMEIPDIIVVNKADHPLTDTMVREIRGVLSLAPQRGWRVPILKTEASRGQGVEELVEQLDEHRAYIEQEGTLVERRRRNLRNEVLALCTGRMRRRLEDDLQEDPEFQRLLDEVVARRLDPASAATEILEREVGD